MRYTCYDGLAACFRNSRYFTLNRADQPSGLLTNQLRSTRADILLRMAVSLRISLTWEPVIESLGEIYPESDCDPLLSIAPGISKKNLQPLFISKLPPELRCRIWSLVKSRSAYYASMMVLGETERILRRVDESTNYGTKELIVEPGSYIEATIESLYGTDYIQNLSIHETSVSEIFPQEHINEVQVISNVHGICAMRFSSQKWTSEWLGILPLVGRIWHGRISVTTNVLICNFHVYLSISLCS